MVDRSSGCRVLLAVVLLLLLGYHAPAFAGEALLTWGANKEADLAGYRVYVGLLPGVYSPPVNVGKVTSWTVPNLTEGVTYYFAVTAYNTAGLESGYSTQVSKLIPPLVDLIAPLLSSITSSNVTLNSAAITWSTDEPSDTQIQYGATTTYGLTTSLVTSLATVHSQTLTNLTPATLYHYRVLSRDATGNLATSADNTFTTAADITSPSVPGNLSGAAVSSSQITLSWTASTDNMGVAGYRVYRNGTQVATAASPGFVNSGLAANSSYSYTVAAYDAAGNLSAQTAAISVATWPLPPVISGAAVSSVTSSAATLSGAVDPSGAATTAWFEYGTTTAYGSSTPPVSLSAANPLSATLSGLSPQTLYHFRIAARNAGGTTTTLDSTFTTPAAPAAAPPPLSPAPANGYTMTSEPYAWVDAPTILALSGDDSALGVPLPFSFPFYGQSYSQLYVSTNGLITFGGPNSAYIPQPIPSASQPNAFIAPFWRDLYVNLRQITTASSATEFVIAFNGVRGLCCTTPTYTFEVILRPDGTILLAYADVTLNATTTIGIENLDGTAGIVLPAVSGNTAFRFTPGGATAPPADTTAPTVPGNLLATVASSTQINLSWTASADNVGVTGYRVYRNGAQIGTTASPGYSDTALVASTSYSYTVSAYDTAGNASPQSAAVSAATLPPPDTTAPVISGMIAGSLTASGALISWSTNESADTQVEYGATTAYGAATPIVSALTTAHSQSLSGLLSSTLYHYRVKSKDAAGNLATSADGTFTTAAPPDTTAPSVPSGLAATASSSSQISLSWVASTDNVGVTGYRIYRNGTQVGTTTSPSYADAGLSASTTYSYTVSAYDAAGNVSAQSAAVSVGTLLPPDTTPPVLSAISVGAITSSSASISWTTNEAATTQIQYGTTTAYGLSTLFVSTLAVAHAQSLTGLLPATLYHYRVLSQDAAGNLATSLDNTFTTAAATIPPPSSTSTTVVINPAGDTTIVGNTSVYGALTTLNTYTWPANKVANAVLMKFNLSSLPAGAVIQSATLNLSLVQADTTADATYTVTAHKILNKNPDLSKATGLTYDGVNGWTANSCCYGNAPMAQADISPAYAAVAVDKVLGSKSWEITAMVQEWVNSPTSNYGLLLNSDATKGVDRYRFFASMENLTTTLWPSLSITYTSPDTVPPVLSNIAVGSITAGGATISWISDEAATSQIEYGTTTAYGSLSPLDATLVRDHTLSLTGLNSSTLYHYRVLSRDAAGNVGTSVDGTFTTAAPPDTTAPSAPSGLTASAVSSSQINLSWTASIDNVGVTGYRIYRNGAQVGTSPSLSYSDSSLAPDTSYSYKVAAYDAAGNLSAQTAAVNGKTLPPPDTTPPLLSGIAGGGITHAAATMTWTTNEPATSQVEYGTTAAYGSSTVPDATLVTSHSVALSGLTPSTIYHYRVISRDGAGNVATSADQTLTTAAPPDTTAPVISGMIAGSLTANGASISWSTDEPSDSQVEYGPTTGYGSSTAVVSALVTAHAQSLTGLLSSTLYHYRVKSKDAAGNVGTSVDGTFTTAAPPDTTAPSVPSGLTASAVSSSQINLSWTASIDNVGVTGYRIYRNGAQIGTSPSPNYADTGLAASTAYSYTVSAYDAAGNVSAQSASLSSATPSSNPSTTVVLNPAADTFLNLDASVNNAGVTLSTYTWPANKVANAVLMKFNLSSLPAGAVIQSATLNLVLIQADTTADATYTVTAHKILNKNPDLSKATGLTYDGVNGWTANSCCYGNAPMAQADISPAYAAVAVDKVLGSKGWEITAMVQEWVNSPTSNYGLLLNSDATKGADRYRFFASMENANAAQRPSLSITYRLP